MKATIKPRIDIAGDYDLDPPVANAGGEEIAAWLSNDVRESVSETINTIESISQGKSPEGYIGTGNAHSLMAAGGYVFLRCEFGDELKVLLTYQQAITALKNYQEFLKTVKVGQEPKPFEVEYEAEGEEALKRYEATGGSLGLNDEEIKKNT